MTDLRLLSTGSTPALTADLSVVRDLAVLPTPEPQPAVPAATRRVMALLAAGVPLTLLFDLADPAGPPSADMLSSESGSRSSLLTDLLAFRADASNRTKPRTLRLG